MKMTPVKLGYARFLAQHQIAASIAAEPFEASQIVDLHGFLSSVAHHLGLSTAIDRGMLVADVTVLQKHGARGELGGAARLGDFL